MTAMLRRWNNLIPWQEFQNITGQDLPPYSVIQNSQINLVDVGEIPTVQAVLPKQYGSQYNCYITGEAKVPAGQSGVCAQPWDVPMVVTLSQQGSIGSLVGPIPGQATLATNSGGFVVVGLGSAPNTALVRMAPMLSLIAQPIYQDIPNQQYGNVDVFNGTTLGSLSDTGYTVSAYNNTGSTITLGTFVDLRWMGYGSGQDQWEIIGATGSGKPILRGTLASILNAGQRAQVAAGQDYTVYDALNNIGSFLLAGSQVNFFSNTQSKQYENLTQLPQMVRAKLQQDLPGGGSAQAVTSSANFGQYVTVHEVLGPPPAQGGYTIKADTWISVVWNVETNQWEAMTAGCQTASQGGNGCPNCPNPPAILSVTLSGFGDSIVPGCSCSINGVYSVPQTQNCVWSLSLPSGITIVAQFIQSQGQGSSSYWKITITLGCGQATYIFVSGSVSDCNQYFTANYSETTGATVCTQVPTSITVQPA